MAALTHEGAAKNKTSIQADKSRGFEREQAVEWGGGRTKEKLGKIMNNYNDEHQQFPVYLKPVFLVSVKL